MFTFATCEVPRAIDFIKKMYPDKREQIPEIGTGGALWKFGPASVCRGACARESTRVVRSKDRDVR